MPTRYTPETHELADRVAALVARSGIAVSRRDTDYPVPPPPADRPHPGPAERVVIAAGTSKSPNAQLRAGEIVVRHAHPTTAARVTAALLAEGLLVSSDGRDYGELRVTTAQLRAPESCAAWNAPPRGGGPWAAESCRPPSRPCARPRPTTNARTWPGTWCARTR